MDVPDAKRLRELESENAKLKKLLAEAMLDKEALGLVARGVSSREEAIVTCGHPID